MRTVLQNTVLRLEIYHKILILQGAVHIVDQSFPVEILLIRLFVVIGDLTGIVPPDQIAGLLCMIKPGLIGETLIHILIDTDTETDPRDLRHSCQLLLKPGKDTVILLRMVHTEVEYIRDGPAADTDLPVAETLGKHLSGLPKDLISHFPSEHLIQHMEMFDVQSDGIHPVVGSIILDLSDILIEELSGIKTAQLVPLCGTDQALILVQLDNSFTPCLDHIRHVVGLRQEVGSTQPDTAHLSGTIRSHNDDRRNRKVLLHLQLFQKLIAVHFRHQKI